MLAYLGILLFIGTCKADYHCLCSYTVEKPVLESTELAAGTIGFLYEFDCKPVIYLKNVDTKTWTAIAFEQQPGFIKMDSEVQVQMCPGDPSSSDLLTSTAGPITTSKPTTQSTIALTSSTIRTDPSSATPTSASSTSQTPGLSTTTKPPMFPSIGSSSMAGTKTQSTLEIKTPTTVLKTTIFPSSKPTKQPTTQKTTSRPTTSSSTKIETSTTTARPTSSSTQSTNPSTKTTTGSTSTTRPSTYSSTLWSKMTTSTTQSTAKLSTPTTPVPSTLITKTTTSSQKPTTKQTTIASVTQAPLGNINLCPSSVVQYATSDGEILTQQGDSCYTVVPHQLSWSHAEYVCNKRGGHLFHVSSQSENLFFYILLNTRFNHSVWMGLNDHRNEEHFEWTSGLPVRYTNWVPGSQSNFQSHYIEDCAVFVPYLNHGQWDDIPCGATTPFFEDLQETHYFICQFPIKTATPVPHPVQSGNLKLCPSLVHAYANYDNGYLAQYDTSCYERVPQRTYWNSAEGDCKKKGGHLLHIGSPQEEAYIQSFLTKVDSQHAVWIGLHDQGHEDSFTWTSGEALTYTNWVPKHRNNFIHHTVENCVAMIPYQQGQWDDIPCGHVVVHGTNPKEFVETHPYICEFRFGDAVSNFVVLLPDIEMNPCCPIKPTGFMCMDGPPHSSFPWQP